MVILKWKEPKQKRRQSPNLGPNTAQIWSPAASHQTLTRVAFRSPPFAATRQSTRKPATKPLRNRHASRPRSPRKLHSPTSSHAPAHPSPSCPPRADSACSTSPSRQTHGKMRPRVSSRKGLRAHSPTRLTRPGPLACSCSLVSHAHYEAANKNLPRVPDSAKKMSLSHYS